MTKDEYEKSPNLVKVREDREILRLAICADEKFKTLSDSAWKTKDEEVTIVDLRKRVEPWLTALFQSEHLSLLIGTGLTSAACYATGGKPRAMEEQSFDNYGAKIEKAAEESAKRLGRGTKNFEDAIRVANELLRGMRIQGVGKAADKLETLVSADYWPIPTYGDLLFGV